MALGEGVPPLHCCAHISECPPQVLTPVLEDDTIVLRCHASHGGDTGNHPGVETTGGGAGGVSRVPPCAALVSSTTDGMRALSSVRP